MKSSSASSKVRPDDSNHLAVGPSSSFINSKHDNAAAEQHTMHLRLISSPPVPKYGLAVTPAAALNSREVKATVAGSVNRS